MGEVLCPSFKTERRSNVIQRLFKSSCIIAKSNSIRQERRTARVSWGILIVPPLRLSAMISFAVGMSANFSFTNSRVVVANSITPSLQHVKFFTWSTTKRVVSLSKKKKNESWAFLRPIFYYRIPVSPFEAGQIFFRCYKTSGLLES